MRKYVLGCFVLAFGIIASGPSSADQATVDALIRAAKEGCRIGSQFDFSASTDGNLTFQGAKGLVTVDVRQGRRMVAFFKKEITVIAEKDTMKCMQRYIDRIYDYIITHPVIASSNADSDDDP